VRAKDGMVSRYGTRPPVGAPATWTDPAVLRATIPHAARPFRSMMTERVEPFGNRISYEYRRDAGADGPHAWDQPLLKRVRYVDAIAGDGTPVDLVSVTFFYDDEVYPDARGAERRGPIRSLTAAQGSRCARRGAARGSTSRHTRVARQDG
jgi:hypothetical protein